MRIQSVPIGKNIGSNLVDSTINLDNVVCVEPFTHVIQNNPSFRTNDHTPNNINSIITFVGGSYIYTNSTVDEITTKMVTSL